MRFRARVASAGLAMAGLVAFIVPGIQAQSPNLVISQVYGAGGNSGALFTNDYVELFNRGAATVSLSGYTVQYASATGTGNFAVGATLSGTLAPGQHYLVQMAGGAVGTPLPTPDVVGTSSMAAAAGKVALVNGTTALACNGGSTPCTPAQLAQLTDLVGYGTANFFEGSAPAPAISALLADRRLGGGCQDTDANSADFTAVTPAPENSTAPLTPCNGTSNPGLTVPVLTAEAGQSLPVVLAVAVTPGANPTSTGLSVTADLSAVGGSGAQTMFDDGVAPDSVAGDLIFTTTFNVLSSLTPAGSPYGFSVTAQDAQARTASKTGTLTITAPLITYLPHDIQGSGATSPLVGQAVSVRGVVTARKFNGFFVQTEPGLEDSDPNTSEGLFVFTSTAPAAVVQVGTLVRVAATVQEFIPSADPGSAPVTELASVSSVLALGTASVPTPVALTSAEVTFTRTLDALERVEGMRVFVASLTAVSGTDGAVNEASATSTSNGTFFTVLTGTARPFREPGVESGYPVLPCAASPAPCNVPLFDGNPERLRVDSDALDGTTRADIATGAVVTNVTGPLDYAFRTYTILPESPLTPVSGMVATPVPPASAGQFTVASFNMERFFDTINDPNGDAVLTPAAYAARLNKASISIRTILRMPDVIGVEEVEKLDVLQAIADKVNLDAGVDSPLYVPYLFEGNDVGGIDVGFLVKTAGGRVTVNSVEQFGLDTTFVDPSDGSIDLLNDRPPVALNATIRGSATSLPQTVTVIVNHLRSLGSVNEDSPTGVRVRAKRQAQAEFLANDIQSRQMTDPSAAIVALGDFNAFEFNDGYGDSMGIIRGMPASPDQAATTSVDLVNPDLVDLAEFIPASERYSYVFNGNAQTLDHVLVTGNLVPQFAGLVHGRVNADFPETLRGDGTRPERLSDHDPVVAYFTFPPDVVPPVISEVTNITVQASSFSGATVTYPLPTAVDNLDGPVSVSCAPPSGSQFSIGTTAVTCSAHDVAGNTSTTTFSVTVDVADQSGHMVGAGQVGASPRVTFAFTVAHDSPSADRGGLLLTAKGPKGAPSTFLALGVTHAAFIQNAASFTGAGWWNGQAGYTFEVVAQDNGAGGAGADTFGVIIRSATGAVVLQSSGVLNAGNVNNQ